MKLASNLLLVLIVFVGIAAGPAMGQRAQLSGTVVDATDGEALPANVVLVGTAVGAQADAINGTYSINGIEPGTYTVEFSLIGYVTYRVPVTLAAGQNLTLAARLDETVLDVGGEVTVVGGVTQKREDFPMPMETVGTQELMTNLSTNSSMVLRKKTGVDIQCTGIDRCETVLRGFNNAFSTATYVLTDYRQSAVASLGVNIFSITPAQTLDVDRIEVVRGPASALYGAGVDAGVIHFFTKDPFTHPGTTVSFTGGERSYLGAEFRHATKINDRVAFKVTGIYGQATDWRLDLDDPADLTFAENECAVDPRGSADCLAAGGARDPDYQKINANATVAFKPGANSDLIVTGGYSTLTATVLSGIGTLQADGYGYTYGQARFQTRRPGKDGFFVQAYVNKNDTGVNPERTDGSFIYESRLRVVDKSLLANFQAQYDRTFGKHNIVGGVDVQLTRPETEGDINGRNETRDNTDEIGAYLQGQFEVHPRVALTGAVRGDYDSITEEFEISPRAAATVHFGPPNRPKAHTMRASFNRAFSSPGTNSSFLDIVAATDPLVVRGMGSAFGHVWNRDPSYTALGAPTDLVSTGLLPWNLGQATPQGFSIDDFYPVLHSTIAGIPTPVLNGMISEALGLPPGVLQDATVEFLKDQLSPQSTTVSGFVPGALGILNPTTGDIDKLVPNLVDIAPLKKTTTTSLELGYTGVFESVGEGLVINIDGYFTQKKNFVGPLLMETPFVLVPSAALLESGFTEALATGITNNPVLAGALQLLGLTPEQTAAVVAGFASDNFAQLAAGPIAIVEPSDNQATPGTAPELVLSYRNFGEIDYYGLDAGFELQASREFSFFGNLSLVSDDYFDTEELGEPEASGLSLSLNATKFKGRLGGQYNAPSGFYVNIAGRYTDSMPIQSGPYVGVGCRIDGAVDDCLEAYFLMDVGAGYVFRNQLDGLRLDVSVSNVLDKMHREFIGAPQLGRMAMARLTYTIR